MKKVKVIRGQYTAIVNRLSEIGDNDIILTTDLNLPIPTSADNGKFVCVNNGTYVISNYSYVDTITYNIGMLTKANLIGDNTYTGEATYTAENYPSLKLSYKIPEQDNYRVGFVLKSMSSTTEYTLLLPYQNSTLATKNDIAGMVKFESTSSSRKELNTSAKTINLENGYWYECKVVLEDDVNYYEYDLGKIYVQTRKLNGLAFSTPKYIGGITETTFNSNSYYYCYATLNNDNIQVSVKESINNVESDVISNSTYKVYFVYQKYS